MLKLFYKTLLVSVLCGSLTMLNFSFNKSGLNVGLNYVQAESVHLDAAKDNDLMSTLTMTSIGFIASRLYKYQMTTDVMIAAAAGVAFIAGEVTAYLGLKEAIKEIEQEIYRTKQGDMTKEQIAVFERLKKSYQEALKTAQNKKSLQQTAATAFALAAVAAYALKSSEMMAIAACKSGIASANTTCPDKATSAATSALQASLESWVSSREVTAPSSTAKSTSTTAGTATSAAQSSVSTGASTDAGTNAASCASSEGTNAVACALAASCPSAAGLVQICSSVKTTFEMSESYGVMSFANINFPLIFGKKVYAANMSKKSDNMFYKIFEKIFLSEAKADLFSPLGIASSAAVNYAMATNASLGSTVDTFLLTPMKRAVVWGVLAGLTNAASSSTDNQIATIQNNIEKIDRILQSMYGLHNGVDTRNNMTVDNSEVTATITQNPNLALIDQKPEDIVLQVQEGTLLCITGPTCPSFSNRLNSQPGISSMPDIARAQIGSLAVITDGLNGASRISGSTLAEARRFNAQSNALKAELAKQQKDIQEKLKASGSKFDLAKESEDLKASMLNTVQKELDKRKTTAGEMLASFGSGRSIGALAVATDATKGAKGAKGVKKAIVVAPVAIPALEAPKLEGDEELNAILKEKKAEEGLAAADSANAATTMDDYQLENDISKDKESSIFELISNRYRQSGYPRLFKRIK